MTTLMEQLFASIGIQNRADLICLIEALEAHAAQLEGGDRDADSRRCRRLLTQARARLAELS